MGGPPKKVVCIVGAGIAGATFALQLLSHLRLSTVYHPILIDELPDPSASKPDETGDRREPADASIGLFGNGLYPLTKLGLQGIVEESSYELTGTTIHRAGYGKGPDAPGSFKCLRQSDNNSWSPDLQTNLRWMEYKRLRKILVDAILEQGGEVRWGRKAKHFETTMSGTTRVHLDDQSVVVADLLVGADGRESIVRWHILEMISPRRVEERWESDFAGQTSISGTSTGISFTVEDRQQAKTQSILLDSGFLSSVALPDGQVRWDLVIPERHPGQLRDQDEEVVQVEHGWETRVDSGPYSRHQTIGILEKHLGVYHPLTGTFGRLLESCDWITRKPLRQKVWKQDEIQQKNVVLIGDASRVLLPSSGQAAGFAVEDATVLAGALLKYLVGVDGRDDFRDALVYYAAQRVPRSQTMASVASFAKKVSMGDNWMWRIVRDKVSARSVKETGKNQPDAGRDSGMAGARFDVEE